MKISIQNLKPGVTEYKESIAPDFIELNFADFYPNNFDIGVLLDKIDRDFRVKISMKSIGHYVCDRCLDEFTIPVEIETEQMFKIASAEITVDDDIIPLASDATEIDLKDVLNETVVLNHPIKMLCSEECKGLCPGCGANLNIEKCTCQDTEIDPRWEELRKLIK
jgi:uncharacterized protein